MVSLAAKLFRQLYGNKKLTIVLKNYRLKLEIQEFQETLILVELWVFWSVEALRTFSKKNENFKLIKKNFFNKKSLQISF